ncbi:MAG: hypothetical protein JW883_12380 [Deltaproteobacteria bacterium]|nr:hypothetical protein [Deltaproteobacteria bacterium]
MKVISIRMPDELLERLRERAAMETIRQKKSVSMNTVALEILDKGLKAKTKGG